MTVGERIKERRLELGMTQDELAKKVGYKSRSSINKLELQRDIPIKKIIEIADALDIEPEKLIGWVKDSKVEEISQQYDKLSPLDKEKKIFSKNLRELVEHSGKMQKDIAKEMGIACTTLNTWLEGKAIPNIAKVKNIANYFHVDREYLLDAHTDVSDSTEQEARNLYDMLSEDDREEVKNYMRFKLQSSKYKKRQSEKIS